MSETAPARPGEELDSPAVERYLARHLPGFEGPLAIVQFPAGHSNLTYLLRTPGRDYVLRRPPFGSSVKSAHDMGREFRVLSRLQGVYACGPEPLAFCDDASVIGAPFYVMTRLSGIILRKDLPDGFDAGLCRRISESLIDNLVTLHGTDLNATGLRELGKPEGYIARQVEGWIRRYRDAQTEEIAEMDELTRWLDAHRPASTGPTLVHNDYKLDNVVLDSVEPSRIAGVLDWEMATIGDPLMDLGTALSYWVEKNDPAGLRALSFGPTDRDGFLSRLEMAERYATTSGRDIGSLPYCYCFGLFKVAVIVQQIYFRYVKGHTADERFARFGGVVRILSRQAAESAASGRF